MLDVVLALYAISIVSTIGLVGYVNGSIVGSIGLLIISLICAVFIFIMLMRSIKRDTELQTELAGKNRAGDWYCCGDHGDIVPDAEVYQSNNGRYFHPYGGDRHEVEWLRRDDEEDTDAQ